MEKIPVRQIKEPDFIESFTIRNIETLLSGKDMMEELHRHNFFLVLALKKGLGEHIIDFTSYTINDYSVFFMRPGQVHQLTLKEGSSGYLMQFNANFYSFREEEANKILRKVSNKNCCRLNSDRFRKAFSVLDYIFQEYTEKQQEYKEVIIANLKIFFIELIRQSKNPNALSKDENSYSQERLEDLLELLRTHVTTHKQVAQYADMLHLTSYQLNAITKETLGKTCSQLINEQLVLEAKRHLLATSSRVIQIAYNLGYEDVSYFIRFFKKHTGYSPEAFRQNFR
ncbi:AraC family transcriptional regulator [Solitalea lacus]|uniref:AraC family transcriptional regulator n=1 Tax=Solitalea lacus TaxID=2911172 RepID=UPI001EDA974E|nr:helix-turn-helix transcriptional regulator [Solitalea lacus]UKJ09304.1 AraC family transcriptional regulator [Solitalea lacus]